MTISMGATWDRARDFLAEHSAAVTGIAALGIFLPAAASGVLDAIARTAGPVAALGVAATSVVLTIVQLWAQAAIAAFAADPALDGAGARRLALHRLPALIGIALLMLLAVVVLALPIVALLAAGGVSLAQLSSGGATASIAPGAAGSIALYGLALTVTAVWLGARLIVLTPVILMERRGVGAIARSFTLTRGHTIKLIGVLVIFAVVTIVAVLAAQFVFGALFGLAFGGGAAPSRLALALTAIVVALVTTIATVVIQAFVGRLYAALAADPAAPGAPA